MPQMFPMNWVMLFYFVIFVFLMAWVKMYFMPNTQIYLQPVYLGSETLENKWLW